MPRKTFVHGPRPGSETTSYELGDFVKIIAVKSSYFDRIGRIRLINGQRTYRFTYVELGVSFTLTSKVVWFRHDELAPAERPSWFVDAPEVTADNA